MRKVLEAFGTLGGKPIESLHAARTRESSRRQQTP